MNLVDQYMETGTLPVIKLPIREEFVERRFSASPWGLNLTGYTRSDELEDRVRGFYGIYRRLEDDGKLYGLAEEGYRENMKNYFIELVVADDISELWAMYVRQKVDKLKEEYIGNPIDIYTLANLTVIGATTRPDCDWDIKECKTAKNDLVSWIREERKKKVQNWQRQIVIREFKYRDSSQRGFAEYMVTFNVVGIDKLTPGVRFNPYNLEIVISDIAPVK